MLNLSRVFFFLTIGLLFLYCSPVLAQAPVINGEKAEPPFVESPLHIDAARLDFGIVPTGQKISKRIEITNTGKDVLKWHATVARENGDSGRGRYIGLVNDEARNTGVYKIPPVYRDVLELSGSWLEQNGHPVLTTRCVLKYQFQGAGLRIYFWKEPDIGKYSVYINQNFIMEIDSQAEKKERAEILLADNLPMGQHTLTLVGKEGKAVLEGFEIYGRTGIKGPSGWISLLPKSGITTREIDYVTVVMNTQRMNPGIYGAVISFSSNGGDADIPVSVEIINDNIPKAIDVYRYASGNDYFFSANPILDDSTITTGRYVKEGIAFRLFPPGTPGTVEFYRWYRPAKKNHFYSHNRNEAGKNEREYIFEGSIGNIATTRLRHTRELYRWYNQRTGCFFYSMDLRGDNIQSKGYRYDGIAGYVR